ncbi:MAG: aspartate aminotransferase family protein [Bryobacteraceae bacterium]
MATTSLGAKPKVGLADSRILRSYAERTPSSAELHQRALSLLLNGVTHAGRYMQPHPIYINRAAGSRKWDADGNEYVDYFGGHGAMLLGHGYPAVIEAVTGQVSRGVHFGSSHELEFEWAEMVRKLIPCAERVRFTSSGTEATMLALRLARAFSGKRVVARFAGHFHGWQDHLVLATPSQPAPAGILQEVADHVLICPPHDVAYLETLFQNRNDIAAIILEPTGATFGQIPCSGAFLSDLRRLTQRYGVLLIFDEVISGFRCSPGGAQGAYGITPDLCTLGKILAGGFPGAAVAGRADVLDMLTFHSSGDGIQPPLVAHQGTYNANPVSAAAGIATLRAIEDGRVHAHANATAAALRHEMNATLKELGVPWCVYGEFSGVHIWPNPANESVTADDILGGKVPWQRLKGAVPIELLHKIRAGFLLHAVDVAPWPGALVSGAHGEDDLDRTVTAFRAVLRMLEEEGDLG